MIKKTQINEGLLLYCIIYLCSFNFWDTKFGMLFKYFFFLRNTYWIDRLRKEVISK